jgi:nucleoside-diphosphate-sugar epimerase
MTNGKNLVVGFTGGFGRATAKALRERGEPVVAFARDKAKAERYAEGIDGVEFAIGDALNPEDIRRASEDAARIFYCVNLPFEKWKTDALDAMNVSMEAAIERDARFVFPGNVYVYGYPKKNPIDESHDHAAHAVKGNVRVEMERAIREAGERRGLRWTIVRLPDFYGPFVVNGLYDQYFLKAARGEKIQWLAAPDATTDYVFIEDAGEAAAIAALSEKGERQEFNVPGPEPITARAFADVVKKEAGSDAKVSFVDKEWMVFLAGLFNKQAREFRDLFYMKRVPLFMDGGKFERTFGEIPASPYADAARKTLAWVRDYFDE